MHLRTFQTPFISYYHDVIEQQMNFLIHYESNCSYKGHTIAYAMAEIS